jgi:DNA-binding NarL/FixJ family response regulator
MESRETDDGARAIVVADMLFASRVRGAAQALGVAVKVTGRPDGMIRLLRETGARLVLVDLELPGGRGPEAIRAVRSEPDMNGVRVVAFSSHTNTAALEAGRDAGADSVLARSAFVTRLPVLLSEAPRSGSSAE